MGSIITLTATDGHTLSAYRAGRPDAARAVVVVQEIFGITPYIRAVCDELATKGYQVIAPAIFDRAQRDAILPYSAEGMKEGLALRARVPLAGTLLDLAAAADALTTEKKGVMGFCWGGTLAWEAACRTTTFAAAVGWYGGGIAAERARVPNCPVQLHFGADDAHIPAGDIDAIRAAHEDIEIFVYEGADHGFGCTDRSSYNETAATLAMQRTLSFFEHWL
ncbi:MULTISPECIES: dienelactone hydrolase family protein [Novacetimonas]|uniref:Dienelactone hydrolase family protein n=1 Tax=Novacetimonas hansenii TaxID=436 RepID=A0AAW5EWP8_NOVHA|nr:dienelactone hydrolase family protein [Novacetimonas hansenii]MBL7237411.1 dienelactone hydrolase family protein [Novacetimonas hansenii]MCJ8355211.1 dienelactone hydrolase family protein [Novacetimonas hansenii]PYD73693.1 dienelactone hydrolase family protein [Novacetimonas hansenii]RFO99041.1 carboxymethylenebutenolidase [Novacetimonas hansenii]WEQ60021.1 dienelactone hydrolase family protein [Novacetimonas hansenii]